MHMNTPERHVVFVPGMNPKPRPALHREMLCRCIIEAAYGHDRSGEAVRLLLERFHMAGWNRLYYGADADFSTDLPWVEKMLAAPDAEPAPALSGWKLRLTRLMFDLGDFMPFLIRLLADEDSKHTIEVTRRYFVDEAGVADLVRKVVKDTLRPLFEAGHEVMVVGHSLGSVIAYDTLWEMSRLNRSSWRVHTLLTLGSPLGMFYVQRRLQGHDRRGAERFPANIRHWINVAALGDLTALDQHVHNDFREMLRLGLVEDIHDHTRVHTLFRTADGPNPHRCFGYFFNPFVARIIRGWLLHGTHPGEASQP